ncbi:RCC1 domain-containing protein, partial [Pedobacter sp. MC2016-05]|uniref:RCC1 domain-containing protein n=1 Tax=Pedobacter sp. MC2016-05 TaxID=2994474 RepID=UPI002247B6F4
TTTSVRTFKQVMMDVREVKTRHQHSLIIKNDNTVWVTGLNSSGQLGDGTTIAKNSFTEIKL